MKTTDKLSVKNNGYQSDDDNVRYKLNLNYFNNANKTTAKVSKKQEKVKDEDDDVRYKLPVVLLTKSKTEQKPKPKPKIKVNFWSSKQTGSRLHSNESNKTKTNRRHTVAATAEDTALPKPKNSVVKVRKRVSFLPSPLFSDNHIPMVTVPDDLTIQLNEEEANDLGEDLNLAFVNSESSTTDNLNNAKRKSKNLTSQPSPKSNKRKRSFEDNVSNPGHENELEFFSKYVVQKLRRMETNQRIYSENLINTVLMLGQLGTLNGKTKIAEA